MDEAVTGLGNDRPVGCCPRMSKLWRRLPSGLVSPWCCTGKNYRQEYFMPALTGYAVGSFRPPSPRGRRSSSPAGNGILRCPTSPDPRAWQGSPRPVGIPGFRNTGTPSGEDTIDLGTFWPIAVRGWRKQSSQGQGWRFDGRAAQATNPCHGSCRGRLKNPSGSCHVSCFLSHLSFFFFPFRGGPKDLGMVEKMPGFLGCICRFRNPGAYAASLSDICCVESGEGRPRSAFGRVTCTSKCQGEQHTNSRLVPNRIAPRCGAVRLVPSMTPNLRLS
ncbi:hypothetical protein B0T18DRAFT_224117 [Schizothecium vesticola]|uniref:Uncharacterized protein n=1 Tax=Schizothecium vesticola TaxID=314040 RepID=A0AA40EKK8_9PEZI|nr:hypothetical protein B0T18DRAFT_224117 [Schizothecium vesticola]